MMIMMKKMEDKEERRKSCFYFMSYANAANTGKRIGNLDVWI
jgi:hypothetical protein